MQTTKQRQKENDKHLVPLVEALVARYRLSLSVKGKVLLV